MKFKAAIVCALVLCAAVGSAFASGPEVRKKPAQKNLDGAYKYVSTTFPGGQQTEADMKGMIVVHGKYMAFVRSGVGRKTWDQTEPEAERTKKIIAAYQGLAATAGSFDIEGNIITLHQVAQANPLTMGKDVKWEYKVEGKMLKIKPVGTQGVEFAFERLP